VSDAPTPDTLEVTLDDVLDDALEFEIDLDELVYETLTDTDFACAPPAPRDEPLRPPQDETPPTTPAPQSAIPSPPPTPAPDPAPQAPTHELPPPFDVIVSKVRDERARALVTSTFARIMKSLGGLRAVEAALTRQKVVAVGALFGGVRAQATSLLSHLTEAVVRGDGLDEEFREVLDGIRFVVAHEMGKVFSYEFPNLTSDGPSTFTRAELTRAWGLLHNCLQQTAITLARSVDPSVTGQELFEEYRSKTENSLTLYRELQALLKKVKTAEKSNGILLKHALVRRLEHFREETMHFLMYKDWGEFGRFVDEVQRAFEEMEDFECVLHGFAQYLSTLIHHVGMREVLHLRRETPARVNPNA
jgi:hypothetical protein